MASEEYHRYLCSREWALKKRLVEERSGGFCERCGYQALEQVHHLSYRRLYNEAPEDLQGLCGDCHQFVSARSDFDPLDHVPDITGTWRRGGR